MPSMSNIATLATSIEKRAFAEASRRRSRLSESEKNDLIAQISQKAIDEALKAVEGHHTKAGPHAVGPPLAAVPTPEPLVEEPLRETASADLASEVERLTAEIEKARQMAKERDAMLEVSMQRSRETMDRLKDTHERMLRALADLENYKKRAAREREETIKFGNERVLKEILPVLDNLDRAVVHAKASADYKTLLEGVELTRRSFEDALSKKGVKGFSAIGLPFDPAVHEALQQVESADAPPNTVVQEVMRGYFLNDRLLRPAAVVVSRPPTPEAPPEHAPEPASAAPAPAASALANKEEPPSTQGGGDAG